jgi:cephalosporin-C deacetylase-like acetyl esterase
MQAFFRACFAAKLTILISMGVLTAHSTRANLVAQESKEVPTLNRFPRMVQEYIVARAGRFEQTRRERLQRIQSSEQAMAYVQEVRGKIRQCFAKMPTRCPLQARVTGVLERDGYRVEKVVFESRPGFLVTANLYVPTGRALPLPGVIGTCGHSNNGKAAEPYQAFCQGLVKQGYVVLIYDPLGQGERLQYPDADLQSRHGVGVGEHLYAGNQMFLVGEFLGSWRAWDGIRALDYLLSRPEVDPQRVGVTGNSGGGTMTTWLCGLDDRWSMAAPSCFVTSFRRNLENELPTDTEQCPPMALALGLDHADFLAASAPRPIIVLTKEQDYFDIRGGQQAYDELKSLYRWLDAEDRVALFTGPTGHGYSRENREAMYGWFNRACGSSLSPAEPEIHVEPDEALWCVPQGQVAQAGSKTVHSFTAEKARQLQANRQNLRGEDLRRAVKQKLRLELTADIPDYRILRPRPNRGYPLPHFTTYAIETEPGIQAIVYRLDTHSHLSRPPQRQTSVLLYVSDLSADQELRSDPWLKELISSAVDTEIYSCDVRGTGESRPDTCDADSFFEPYGSDYFYAIHAIMLDDPYVGQKARDILQVIRWLRAQGRSDIHLVSQGRGTIATTIAALFASGANRVTLRGAPRSFQEMAESESYSWPLSCLIPAVLESFDLPDVYGELSGQVQLELLEPRAGL